MASDPTQQLLDTVHSAAQTYADQVAATASAAVHTASAGAIDPFVFRLAIFALAVLRRLLRRVVGDAGAAYAADVGHQRHFLGHRRRRASLGRCRGDDFSTSGDGPLWAARIFGFIALILASVNIFGGFLVTERMLAMYKKKG